MLYCNCYQHIDKLLVFLETPALLSVTSHLPNICKRAINRSFIIRYVCLLHREISHLMRMWCVYIWPTVLQAYVMCFYMTDRIAGECDVFIYDRPYYKRMCCVYIWPTVLQAYVMCFYMTDRIAGVCDVFIYDRPYWSRMWCVSIWPTVLHAYLMCFFMTDRIAGVCDVFIYDRPYCRRMWCVYIWPTVLQILRKERNITPIVYGVSQLNEYFISKYKCLN